MRQIKPHHPYPFRKDKGNKIVREPYKEPFIDRMGNKATVTYVDYTHTRKGKTKLYERYVLYVKWED